MANGYIPAQVERGGRCDPVKIENRAFLGGVLGIGVNGELQPISDGIVDLTFIEDDLDQATAAAAQSAAEAQAAQLEAETANTAAQGAKADAQAAASDAQAAQTAAEAAKTAAQVARAGAETAQTGAQTAQAAAQTAQTGAQTAQTAAENAATDAAGSASDAEDSATAAAGSATQAGQSATNAASSAAAASGSASQAAGSATQAGQSATAADTSATAAHAAQTASETAQAAAEAAQAGAEAAEAQATAIVPGVVTSWLNEHVDPATGYVIDDTLSIQGAAADAKAVGVLKDAIDGLEINTTPVQITGWVQGYISSNGGTGSSSTNCVTSGYWSFGSEDVVHLRIADGYKFAIGEYTTNAVSGYVGRVYTGSLPSYDLENTPGHYYRFQIVKTDSSAVTPSSLPEDFLKYYYSHMTDKTLSLSDKIADAKATGEAINKVYTVRSHERYNVICNMQSGHGFTNPFSTGSAPADDTVDYIAGTQSVFFSYAGQATIPTLDLRYSSISVTFKVKTISSGATINLYLSDVSSFSRYIVFPIYRNDPSNQFEPNVWATVTASTGSGATTSVDLSKIKYIRFSTSGDATYNVQSVGYLKKGTQRPCISFTFDDGWAETMLGAKILALYDIPATAYIFRGCELSLDQLKSLRYDYGWDIEMHGANVFTGKTKDELTEELQQLQAYIRDNGLGSGEHLAYPGGQNNRTVVEVVSRYCKTARTINNTSSKTETIPPPMPYNLRANSGVGASGISKATVKTMIDSTVATNSWLILVFHRIGDTATSMFCSEADLAEIAEYAVASGADIKTIADMWERN